MHANEPSPDRNLDVLRGGRFAWVVLVYWLPCAAGLGGAAAWLAVAVQEHFAPLLLFPILVGVGVGALNVGLMRLAQMGNRPTALLGTLLAVAVAVLGQHYLSYRQQEALRQRQIEAMQQTGPPGVVRELAPPPLGFAEYMRRQAARGRPVAGYVLAGWAAWLSWAVDGLLVLAAALAMVIPAARLPYCKACRSWYRTVRAGRVPLALAQRLAEVASATIDDPVSWVRYRLACCQGGCGPTRLELFWESPERGGRRAIDAWLDVEHRQRAMAALDEG
jgi:hypothetical protein